MSPYQRKQMSWLEWRSQVTGKSVEEIRESMRERSKLADRSKSGFASLKKNNPEKYQQALEKSLKTRQARKDVVD